MLDAIVGEEYMLYKEHYTYPYNVYGKRIFLMIVGLYKSPIFDFHKYSSHYATSRWIGHSSVADNTLERRANEVKKMYTDELVSSVVVQGYDLVRKVHRQAYLKKIPKDVFRICLHQYEPKEAWKARTEELRDNPENVKMLNLHYGAYHVPSEDEGFSIIVDNFQKVLQLPHLIGNI